MESEPEEESLVQLIKKGNKSSAVAMIGNAVIAAIKGVAAAYSGSGAMFASAMHSFADAINQGFVFVGSVLSEKKPTRQFEATEELTFFSWPASSTKKKTFIPIL
ncbi:hypothetical protein FPZ49_14490 [Paenibacillus cremeus]|uniref:Cation efflux protein transmembrane domain-containing protein n=1 Tax=Paenibacillus cremeus TaxID=2163881 RepID=A0A559KAI9_9BACL|nr:hypothetical protein FPZ49_14490 [Paenibacillus cremeus]